MRDDSGKYASPEDKHISSDMEELLGLYLSSLKELKSGTSQSTVQTRQREVRYWLAFCEANDIDPLAAVTDEVRGYIQSISELADTTVGSYYRSVQSFYSIVEKDYRQDRLELANGHPCRNSDTIDMKEDHNVYEGLAEYKSQHRVLPDDNDDIREFDQDFLALKPDKIQDLFDEVPGKKAKTRRRNEIAIRLNWYTGCRSVELSRLSIGEIDWDKCKIEVRSAKLNKKEHGDLIRRDVYFPEEFKIQLRQWCERERHAYSSVAEPNSGNILVTTQGNKMDGTLINDVVKKAAENAGIQRPLRPPNPGPDEEVKEWLVTTHRIRRSAITHWVNDLDAIDLHQARRLAGHARIEQTMDYIEDDDEQLAEDYHQAWNKKESL